MLLHLLENLLFVKAEKCEFHSSSVSFLGYVISAGSVQIDPAQVSAVPKWPNSDFQKQLQQFLGFANFYRRFIRNYSTVVAPFTSVKRLFGWMLDTAAAFLVFQ